MEKQFPFCKTRLASLLLIFGFGWTATNASAQLFEKVLLSDEFFLGERISSINGPPELNDEGKVVFVASMTPNSADFLFTGKPGSLELLAREGSPADGVPGEVYELFNTENNKLTINPSGLVMFQGEVNTPATNDGCLWIGTPGNVQLIGREDGPTPALPGEFFSASAFFNSKLAVNHSGDISFSAVRKGTPSQSGIWAGAPTNLSAAALSGTLATNVGVNYSSISGSALSRTGNIAFQASLNSSADKALFAGPTNALIKVFRFGETCHGMTNVNYGGGASDGISFDYFNDNLLTYSLRISGVGVTTANDAAFWAGTPDAPQLIVREGDALPANLGGGNITGANTSYINTNGHMLIQSRLQATGTNILFWSDTVSRSTNWIEVAREGSPLAGLGLTLSNVFTTLAFSLSDNGDVIFYGGLSGPGISTTNNFALLRWIPSTRTVQRIVQEGDFIEVAPGDLRKITDFDFSGSLGHSASHSCGVNSRGQVGFSAVFTKVVNNITNTTRGIMIAHRPSTFADWAWRAKLPPGQNGPGDDANSDGVPNVMAYYFGFNGTDVINMSDVVRWNLNGANVEMEFERDATVTDVTAEVKVANEVDGAWGAGPAFNVINSSGGKETLRATIFAGGEKGFAQLVLSGP